MLTLADPVRGTNPVAIPCWKQGAVAESSMSPSLQIDGIWTWPLASATAEPFCQNTVAPGIRLLFAVTTITRSTAHFSSDIGTDAVPQAATVTGVFVWW